MSKEEMTQEVAEEESKVEPGAEENEPEGDPEGDLDGDDDEGKDPLWMQESEESDQVPLSALMKQKGKTKDLRGKLDDRDEENEQLRREISELKQGQPGQKVDIPKRPRLNDFDSDEDYETAMDEWDESRSTATMDALEKKRGDADRVTKLRKQRDQSVTDHYTRAEKLVKDNAIKPDVYKAADVAIRNAVNAIMPDMGDDVTDSFISILGDGSEKTMFYLGRNKTALNEFRTILQDDPTGLKAAAFLGSIKNQLSGKARRNSNAPAPAANANGEVQGGAKAGALKKKYDAAHKKGNISEAFKLKRQAKKAGHDTKNW